MIIQNIVKENMNIIISILHYCLSIITFLEPLFIIYAAYQYTIILDAYSLPNSQYMREIT